MLTFCRVTNDVLVIDVHLQLAVALLSGVLCSQQHSLHSAFCHLSLVVISRLLVLPCTQQTHLQTPDTVAGGKNWHQASFSVQVAAFSFSTSRGK